MRVAIIDAELRRAGIAADLSDDCAVLAGPTALVTTDVLVEGRHFDVERDTPEQIGAQAAVSNLSDLAGSGGAAGWLVWALTLSKRWDHDRFRRLVRGFAECAAAHGAQVVGGNLSATDGPAVIAVTAGGPLAGDRPFTRAGARPGDAVWLTGPLGDAALGYLEPDPEARAMRHRWRPHLAEAAALARWGRVTAAMDISDGLLIDGGRLARASGVQLALDSAAIPTSDHYRARRGDALDAALTGGEDYVLLFCAPPGAAPPVADAHRIGTCRPGDGISLDGCPVEPGGHDHFDPTASERLDR